MIYPNFSSGRQIQIVPPSGTEAPAVSLCLPFKRAIRAYEKAGFITTRTYEENGIEIVHLELKKE